MAVANRILGVTQLFVGHPTEARANLEEAMRLYDPERDRDTKFRFGPDTGICTPIYLALANWLLGDVGRARELIEDAVAHAAKFPRIATKANACYFKAICEIIRGDAEAAQHTAETIVALSREHGLALYQAYGTVSLGWARARLAAKEPT